jgi:hypothetical protein
MAVEITVSDGTTQYLQGAAGTEFRKSVEKYACDLLREASRLEASGKATQGDPEITSTMVRDADLLLRKGYVRPAKKPLLIAAQMASPIAGFLTGLLGDMDLLKEPWTMVLFVVLLAVTITSTAIAVLKE